MCVLHMPRGISGGQRTTFLSPPRGFWDQAKVVRLVHQALDLLSHLTSPIVITFESRHPMHCLLHSQYLPPSMAVIISSLSTESSGSET